jgi:hypothetical protein
LMKDSYITSLATVVGHEAPTCSLVQTNLLVPVQSAEDFGCIEEVRIVENPTTRSAPILPERAENAGPVLLDIERKQRQIQDQSDPVSVDQEQESQDSVDSGFGDDVGVKAVAQVDRVNVIAFEIRIPDITARS